MMPERSQGPGPAIGNDAVLARTGKAWGQLRTRRRWLQDPEFTVRESTTNKSMRITWVDGKTHVSAVFMEKGPDKCQVSGQHAKLRGAAAAERMKAYWGRNLARLKEMLES